MKRSLPTFLLAVTLLLAACQAAPQVDTLPEDVNPPASITWDRSPSTVVFRIDVVGGGGEVDIEGVPDAFERRNDIPYCTVYGDNRVVSTNEVGPFDIQVLYDIVTDDAVRLFVEYLTVSERLYTYDARADLQPPGVARPVYEQIELNVNGQPHLTDAFAGWDYNYFLRILEVCRQISSAPVLFEPAAAYISAREVPYEFNAPVSLWNAEAASLSFAELAASGEQRWVEGRNVAVLWNILRTSQNNIRFQENDLYYQIAVEVPNITRESPPAPSSAG